jgi:hypothetical protein
MTQRAASMPIPGQAHYTQSGYHQNVSAPGITPQPSHPGMPGRERYHSGGWPYRECIVYSVHANQFDGGS